MTARWMPVGADWIAGLSIAGLLLPEAVAYSGIAGAPSQAGVIALFAGLLVYGLLGTSRFAIVSSTSFSAAVLLRLARVKDSLRELLQHVQMPGSTPTAIQPGAWTMPCRP
ncbi:Sulfate transporter N-terminal domain with GLY motif [Comamonas thiooxydans]|nr:Sulfate transporter N-terminal domain with GLY motif [Comamonas thiooxydans]